jgi:hypothetical protein
MLHLRIVNDLVNGIDGSVGHVVAAQPFDPMIEVAARESLIELGVQRIIVVDSRLALPEARRSEL